MSQSGDQEDLVAVGKVGRAVGLDGICAVEAFGSTLLESEYPLVVRIGKNETDTSHIQIEELQKRPKGIVCRFEGISDRTAAEQITGQLVFIERSRLPELRNDEYYHFELEGMTVFSDLDNELIGIVSTVYNFPAADTLEVKRNDGSLILIPLSAGSVLQISKSDKRIIVRKEFLEELL